MKQPILNEDNFNKLPQLDRIEYRQKEDRLIRRYSTGGGVLGVMIFFWLWLIGTVAMTGLIWVVTHSVNLMLYIINIMRITLWLWIIVFTLALASEFYTIYRKSKAFDKLQTEYLTKLPKIIKQPGRPKKQNGI